MIAENKLDNGEQGKTKKQKPGWFYILLIFAGVTLVSGLPYLLAARDALRVNYDHYRTPLPLPAGMSLTDLKEGNAYQVEEADTVEFVIDGRVWPVLLAGIVTPVRGEKCYREATDRTFTLTVGKVYLLDAEPNQDASGRLVRYVFLEDGTSVPATLVAEGFARAQDAPGPYRDQLMSLQQTAQAEGRGCLWAGEAS